MSGINTEMEPTTRTSQYMGVLRELGVLVTVFGPMYCKFETKVVGLQLYTDMLPYLIGGIFAIIVSIEIERRQ